MSRFALLCALLFVSRVTLCVQDRHERTLLRDRFPNRRTFDFSVDKVSDLLNGNVIGVSLFDEEVAEYLEEKGFTLGEDVVKFERDLDDVVVDGRKCLFETELRDATITGKVDVGQGLQFTATMNFLVVAEAALPLDLRIEGTMHTDVKVPLGFACPRVADVDVPLSSDISATFNVTVGVFLNPVFSRRDGKKFMKLAPQISVKGEVFDVNAASDVEFKALGVRISVVEGFLEGLANDAIEREGDAGLDELVENMQESLQELVDEELADREIDIGDTIDAAEDAGALDQAVNFARLAFFRL